jgi:hypothetical protein
MVSFKILLQPKSCCPEVHEFKLLLAVEKVEMAAMEAMVKMEVEAATAVMQLVPLVALMEAPAMMEETVETARLVETVARAAAWLCDWRPVICTWDFCLRRSMLEAARAVRRAETDLAEVVALADLGEARRAGKKRRVKEVFLFLTVMDLSVTNERIFFQRDPIRVAALDEVDRTVEVAVVKLMRECLDLMDLSNFW